MATINDIAKMAGVSRGTVDRVFNDRGHVDPDTEQKIWEAAEALNYIPKRSQLALDEKDRIKIGFVIYSPDVHPFWTQVQNGAVKKIDQYRDMGVEVVIEYNIIEDKRHQERIMDKLVGMGVQGIIFCGVDTPGIRDKIDHLWKKHIPVITLLTDIDECHRLAYIGNSSYTAGRIAGQLMKMLIPGPISVGVVAGPEEIYSQTKRLVGFTEYFENSRDRAHITHVLHNHGDDFDSYQYVNQIMKECPETNAILITTIWVYGACRAVEQLPPEKRPIVICFDNVPSTQTMLKKGIVTVTIERQPEHLSAKALDLMYGYLILRHKPSKEKYLYSNNIIIKESLP